METRLIVLMSMRRLSIAILSAWALLLALPRAQAQADFEKGFQAYQSYHGSDFDTVNLANGNLVLDIPLLSYEQRGGLPPVVVSIRSNSTTFQSTPPYLNGPLDTQQHEVSSGVIGAPWGQPHVSISPGGLSWREERIVTASHTGSGGPEYLTRFVALDDSGATHSLGGAVANLTQGLVPGILYSVDGSGLMLKPGTTQTGQQIIDRKGNIGGLIDPHGNTITLNGHCAKPVGSGDLFDPSLASWEVYAHGTASAHTITDSIGRVIPNPTYLPPAASYSCLVDLDATYHPATTATDTCETWNFPAQSTEAIPGQPPGTIPLIFCYKQIAINGRIPIPLSVGAPIPNGGSNTYDCHTDFPNVSNTISCETINETWWVLYKVTLPNNTFWQFDYDSYGQVSAVTMPTGAKTTYSYLPRLACGNPPGQIPVTGVPSWPYSNLMSSRMVTSRTLDVNNDGTDLKKWYYTSMIGNGWAGSPNSGTVTVTDPDRNDTVHTFTLYGSTGSSTPNSVCGPYESSTVYYQGPKAAGTILKQVDTTYSTTGTDYANPTNFSNYVATGVFPRTVTTTLDPGSSSAQVSTDSYVYDKFGTYQDYLGVTHPFSFGQTLASQESDWAAGGATPMPLRTTLHTYLWQSNWSYYAANLIDLPCLETVLTGGVTTTPNPQTSCTPPSATTAQVSQTTYGYDETAYSGDPTLGNPTSVNRWLQGRTTPVSTHSVYTAASYGMPTQHIDALGKTTTLTYDSSNHLYLTSVQHPSTITNGQTVSHIEHSSYDPSTGQLNSSTDENSQITSYRYDAMRRLIRVDFPNFGWETYTYTDTVDTPSFTYNKALLNSSQVYTATGTADGLGRVIQTKVAIPSGTIFKDTTYDQLGRVQSVTNPYTAITDPTYGFTSYSYDALGRKLYQCQPDNTQPSPTVCNPSNSYLQWTYSGSTTISSDELHNSWSRTTDGLGRLINVVEPTGLNTHYTYNTLGNLVCADQWGHSTPGTTCTSSHTRSFTYDTLSRLLTASNPETGTLCYGQWSTTGCTGGYDDNGNLLHKTDARSVTINYLYDDLNRLLSKTYTGDSTGTATSCYQYDLSTLASGTSYLAGRLTNAWTQTGTCAQPSDTPVLQSSSILTRRSILAYDTMGRVLSEQQCTRSNCASGTPYNPTYTYDLAGNMLQHTNGIGTYTFTNCYDNASRLALVVNGSSTCPAASGVNLFSSPTYSPAGGLTGATFGSGLQLARTYDTRLRIHTESDTGSTLQGATPSSATIQILGADQTH